MAKPTELLGYTVPGVRPSGTKPSAGYSSAERPNHDHYNWALTNFSDWIKFVDDINSTDGSFWTSRQKYLPASPVWFTLNGVSTWNYDGNTNWTLLATESGELKIPIDNLMIGEVVTSVGVYLKNITVDTPTLKFVRRDRNSDTFVDVETLVLSAATGWQDLTLATPFTVTTEQNYFIALNETSAANLMVVTAARYATRKNLTAGAGLSKPPFTLGWSATGLVPSAGLLANGWSAGDRPQFEHFDNHFKVTSDWLAFLQTLYSNDGAEYTDQERYMQPSPRWSITGGSNWTFSKSAAEMQLAASGSGLFRIPLDDLLSTGDVLLGSGFYVRTLSGDTPSFGLERRARNSDTFVSISSNSISGTGWTDSTVGGGGYTVLSTENYYLTLNEPGASNAINVIGARLRVEKLQA